VNEDLDSRIDCFVCELHSD